MENLSEVPLKKFLPRKTDFTVGVDLGQSTDYTAIAILEHIKGVWDEGSPYERHTGQKTTQHPGEFVHARWLERLPLGMPYPDQVQQVKEILARPGLDGARLVLDETGVGRPVGDIFNEAGLKPRRVSITGGTEQASLGNDRWSVPKMILISTVDALLHTGSLEVAPELPLAEVLKEELKDFRRKMSGAGRPTYGAREGKHDDLVLAVAIGCWWTIKKPTPPTRFFTWNGPEILGMDRYGNRILADDKPKGD
jgi:hypothetical protein